MNHNSFNQGHPPLSVAFIAPGLTQTDILIQELNVDQVFVLNNQTDTIEQISQTLSQFQDLDSIHIISHGSQGSIQLGSTALNQSTVNTYATDLESWGEALTEQGDLLFYGCNIGAGNDGLTLLQDISALTNADVAASDDLTGQGGDWSLETSVGPLEATVALSQAGQSTYQGTLATIGESGRIDNLNHQWTRITLQETYTNPVVVAGPPSFNGPHPTTVRIRNVTNNSFEVRIDEWEYLDEWHTTESLGYLVVEEGTHTLADGTVLQAGTNQSNNNWGAIDFSTPFTNTPLLFAQTTSENERFAVAERIRNVTPTGFDLRLQEEEAADQTHAVEDVDWIAIAPSSGTFGTIPYIADQIASDHRNTNASFNSVFSGGNPPIVLAQANTNNGGDPFAIRYRSLGTTGATLFLEEEQSRDSETRHVLEDVAYLALGTGLLETPDPVTDTFSLADTDPILVDESAGVVTVTAVRTGEALVRATLEYTTNEVGGADAASADVDFTPPTLNGRDNTGEIVFEIGETEKTFTIPIIDDTLFEGNETFAVGIQNASNGSLGAPRTALITIVDDDAASTLSVTDTAISVEEGTATASITVQRSGDSSGAASVDFSTSNGTAVAGEDYTATSGTLNFAAGQITQTLTIPILNDAFVEGDETFAVTLSNPTGGILGNTITTNITILDNDLALGDLNRTTAVSGLIQPTTLDWTPDGRYMLVAQKNGVVRVIDNGVLQSTPLVNLSSQVNDTRDRGLLGLAIHPDFPNTPYVYLLYTYDPPETIGNSGLAAPDANGNRPSRMVRLTVDPTTMVADPNSLVVLAGTNSTWAYTSQPDSNSTGNISILPSGIVNGNTITAPADQIDTGTQDNDPDRPGTQNQNIRDYLATDSTSHSIGDLEFGPDGYLYLSNGDGTSFNFTDPRGVRVQDINNLSGKVLRIDPITGEGITTNPFFNGDANSNPSKVFYSGLRNPYRFTFDPVTQLPVIGDVGWTRWEEINTGVAGSNFGWPYLEGPNRTGGYQDLPQAASFYSNGNRNNPGDEAAVFPLLSRSHGAPDNANAITVGDFYNSNTLMFGDVNNGTLYAATFDSNRQISNVQVFDSNIPFVVDMKMGPDGRLYGVDLASGEILRWDPVNSGQSPQPNLSTSFDNFADLSSLNLNGSATGNNDRLRLTPASGRRTGSAFINQAFQVDSDTNFSTQFQFQITGGQGTDGADGFTLVLQNSTSGANALGGLGGSLGYAGIANSIAIEFDTYDNGAIDINNNHLSILRNGSVDTALASVNAPFDLNNGNPLTAWVDYDGDTDLLRVYLSDTDVQPVDAVLSTNIDLAGTLGNQAFVGFTAGTGGRTNDQDILDWSFNSTV